MGQYGKYFDYNGESSEKYNLITGGYNVEDYEFGLERNVDRSEMNRYRSYTYTYGTVYDDVLTFPILFIKDPCKYTDSEEYKVVDINNMLVTGTTMRRVILIRLLS